MKSIIRSVTLILLTLIPFLAFGHIRGLANWLSAYLFYTISYFIIGLIYNKFKINIFIYHSIVLLSLISYAILLFFEDYSYFYPAIAPTIFIAGVCGYLFGYLSHFFRIPSLSGLVVILLFEVYGCYQLLPAHFFNKMRDYPSLAHLKEKKLELNFQDLNGAPVPKEFFKNKIVVLDFWYTGCEACLLKHREYEKIFSHFSKYPDVIIATVIDGEINSLSGVNSFLSRHKYKFPTYYDPGGEFIKKYKIGIDGYPVEIRLNRNSEVKEVIYSFGLKEIYLQEALSVIEDLVNR
ncbi:TlpA family protein disulfide reductase [Larkinella sp. VNQ87]|uniref:TlpA family protein disulfide reductase n=1 Tax=Larkinella sp. VNQ87 TaxID=3400921 RepID=UPI003BFC5CB6